MLKRIRPTKTKIPLKMASPFKDQNLLEKEIIDFANRFKATIKNHSKRISDYFEMSCFNYVVHFYELKGYKLNVKNLIGGEYRYKCSTAGIQSNFSFFEASIITNGTKYKFEIQHNLAVQSSHDISIFTTPDISVIKSGKAKTTNKYYDSGKRFSYVQNNALMTFCEAKQFTPFPELIFNFIGIVNELKKEYMQDNGFAHSPVHLAPSLMISGKPNKQTWTIKESLESRYCINIIYDLFYSGTSIFSKINILKLRVTGKKPSS